MSERQYYARTGRPVSNGDGIAGFFPLDPLREEGFIDEDGELDDDARVRKYRTDDGRIGLELTR